MVSRVLSTGVLTEQKRAALARRGRRLEALTVAWGAIEAGVALAAAVQQRSTSLTGFGLDSLIEVISAVAVFWRMSHELTPHRRERAEQLSLRIAGYCLLAVGGYVLLSAILGLASHHAASPGAMGIAITAAALLAMPLLARAKRGVGSALGSSAMMTDAKQTDFCMYQAAAVLLGLLAQRLFGIWWADDAAALVLVPLMVRAGIDALRGKSCSCAH